MQHVNGCEDDARHAGLDTRIWLEGFRAVTPSDGMPVQDIKAPEQAQQDTSPVTIDMMVFARPGGIH